MGFLYRATAFGVTEDCLKSKKKLPVELFAFVRYRSYSSWIVSGTGLSRPI